MAQFNLSKYLDAKMGHPAQQHQGQVCKHDIACGLLSDIQPS